jgi:hypothetical protein
MTTLVEAARSEAAAYGHGEHRPLGSFLVVMGTYTAGVVGSAIVGRVAGVRVPDRPAWGDLGLLAVATQRVSRLLSKDAVTSPLRAPFTQFEEAGAPGEVNEQVRGTGARKAVGELLSCPFCSAQWVGTAFLGGLVLAPRATRWVAAGMSLIAAADLLQFGYSALSKHS